METTYLIICIVAVVGTAIIGYLLGKKSGEARCTPLQERIGELQSRVGEQESIIARQTEEIRTLTSERDVQCTNAANAVERLEEQRSVNEQQIKEIKKSHEQQCNEMKEAHERQLSQVKEAHERQLSQVKEAHERQLSQVREAHEQQLSQVKEATEKQLEALKEMNKKQVEAQLALIKEQMKATSESVLKARQEELGERNKEQVSAIIDPLQKSLKEMQEAFNKSKEQQAEAMTRLDATIKVNMEKSAALGETADRLTRALTGEVKVQGNFGELKLKQLLEDLELKEGEQYDTQETLRDQAGKALKSDEGRGLIPDFILHFPNNRHVVVDAKMSLTDYERYMNAEDGDERTICLQAHLRSIREQVKRLAKKDYTRYLPQGYNRLNFAIMYVPVEGALNLALQNDTALWREAYDEGVLILGPQTMYMNLRVLEMMWTQVRQLTNQQVMMDAANIVIERIQDFGIRFMDVEASMNDTIKKMSRLKITTADGGPSIITAARNLLKAGAKENKKKKAVEEIGEQLFIDTDDSPLLEG